MAKVPFAPCAVHFDSLGLALRAAYGYRLGLTHCLSISAVISDW
jgi:hypothetical protein